MYYRRNVSSDVVEHLPRWGQQAVFLTRPAVNIAVNKIDI